MGNKAQSMDSNSRIREASRRWFPKPPKKFNKNIINEVYLIASSLDPEILDILIDTHYFQNILWPNLGEDSSNNHLEIIIYLVLRDLDLESNRLIEIILADQDKYHKLLNRLLGITASLNFESNLKSQSSAFLFLGKLFGQKSKNKLVKESSEELFGKHITQHLSENIKEDVDIMKGSEFKNNDVVNSTESVVLKMKSLWFYNILKNYMNLILNNKFEEILKMNTQFEENFIDHLSSFFFFLIVCSSSPDIRTYVLILIQELKFTCIFYQEKVHSRLLEFINILHYYINFYDNTLTTEKFSKFQKVIYTNFIDIKNAREITLAPSVYDVTEMELRQLLNGFEKEELENLCQQLHLTTNVPAEYLTHEFMSEIIVKNHLSKHNIKLKYEDFTSINEVQILDDFYGKYYRSSIFQPEPLPCLFLQEYLSSTDFEDAISLNSYYDYKAALNKHVLQVLDRLKISVDSSMKLSIKGNSKYFANIDNIKGNGFEFHGIISKKDFDLEQSELVIVLEIIKPNKYSPYKRMKSYGINKMKLCLVKDVISDGKRKQCFFGCAKNADASDEKSSEETSYVIKLPQNFEYKNYADIIMNFSINQIPLFLSQTFIGDHTLDLENQKRIGIQSKFKINSIPLSILKDIYNIKNLENSRKKRKLNSPNLNKELCHILQIDSGSLDAEVFEFKSDEVAPELDMCQSKALLSSLRNNITKVRVGPHTGYKRYLNSILTSLSLNYSSKEKALVILPNKSSLEQIQIPEFIELKSFKNYTDNYKEEIMKKFKNIELLLSQVDTLAQNLGLLEYGYSHNCENAILFFKQHIEPRWISYLESVRSDNTRISEYPFDSNLKFCEDMDENYRIILDSYLKIKEIFLNLEIFAPLKKLEHNYEEAVKYFLTRIANFVFITPDNLFLNPFFYEGFSSVIYVNYCGPSILQMLPFVNNPYLKRVILIDNPLTKGPALSLTSRINSSDGFQHELKIVRNIRLEFFDLFKLKAPELKLESPILDKINPGFKYVHQIIEIDDKVEHPNVSISEAEYTVLIIQYMLSIGYSYNDIGIVVYSPYQKALIEELCSKAFNDLTTPNINMYNEAVSQNMIIQSLFGSTPQKIEKSFTLPRKGNYMVGNLSKITWDIPSGKLEIFCNETLDCTEKDRHKKKPVMVKNYDHFVKILS